MKRGARSESMDKAVREPSLEVFRVFDVAGRHESFARAARELCVTPGAIAHRVRTLEHYLGEELFERRSHSVALSVRGQAFLVEIQHSLCALDRTIERFRSGANAGVLKLVAVEAFAEMWLMPRLAAFRRTHPEVVIEFETDHHEVDPARRAFDVWIAFVAEVPSTVRSEVLFEETLVPVCSPGLLASRGRPGRPADLHGWPLLYDLAWKDYWAHWFACREAGAPDMSRASGYRLYSMTVQAALKDMGVALAHDGRSLRELPFRQRPQEVRLRAEPLRSRWTDRLAAAAVRPDARCSLEVHWEAGLPCYRGWRRACSR